MSHLRHVVRPENELRKSRNLLWIKAFKSQGVDSEYEAFDPPEAQRIAAKLDIHYTPKHGSWLNTQNRHPVT